ncbi:N-terminal nucleophile aminohydrolase, partial [Suillus decipiens]
VEYANKAVENSDTAIGLRVKDGVVLAVEKLIHSKLLVPGANRCIQTVDKHIDMAFAGLLADGRKISQLARDAGAQTRKMWREPLTVKNAQTYTLYSSVRPFGVSTIFGGVDKSGPSLYIVEPSGVCLEYHSAAVGKGRQLAKTELEKLKLWMREAVMEAARIIYLVHDDNEEKEFELEMTWVGTESNDFHL